MNQFPQFNLSHEDTKTKISYPKEFCSPVKYFCHNLDCSEDDEELLCPWKTDDNKIGEQLSQTNGQIMRKQSKISKRKGPFSSNNFQSSQLPKQHPNIRTNELGTIAKQQKDGEQSSPNQQRNGVENNFLELFDKQKSIFPHHINKSQQFNPSPVHAQTSSLTTQHRNKRSNTFSNGVLNRLQTEGFEIPQVSKIEDTLLIQDNFSLSQKLQPNSTRLMESSAGAQDSIRTTPHRKIIDFISTLRTELLSRSKIQNSILEAALAGKQYLPPKQLNHKQNDNIQSTPHRYREPTKEDSMLRSNSVFVHKKRAKMLKDHYQQNGGAKYLRKLQILDENSSLTTISAQKVDSQKLQNSEKEKQKLRVNDVNSNIQNIALQEKEHSTKSQQGKVFEFTSHFDNLAYPLKVSQSKEGLVQKNNLHSAKNNEKIKKVEGQVPQTQQNSEHRKQIMISSRYSQFQRSIFTNQFNAEENRQSSPEIYISNEGADESENSPTFKKSRLNCIGKESALLNGFSEFKGRPSDLFRKNTFQKKSTELILNKSFDCIANRPSDLSKSKIVFGSIAHHLKEAILKEKDPHCDNLLVSNIINENLSLEAKHNGRTQNKIKRFNSHAAAEELLVTLTNLKDQSSKSICKTLGKQQIEEGGNIDKKEIGNKEQKMVMQGKYLFNLV